jgi:hypothetical protein
MRAWLLIALLGASPPNADPLRVELDLSGLEQHMDDSSVHRFHGELLLRLIEAGHGVGAEGDLRLSLTSTGSSVVLDCLADDARERLEVEGAEAAVLGLELVHRAVALIERCAEGRAPRDRPRRTVVIDNDGSREPAELLVELADTPVTVVVAAEHADMRLCVREREFALLPVTDDCATADMVADDPRVAVAAWLAADSTPSEPEPEPEPEPELPRGRRPVGDSEPTPWAASVGAGAGTQLRFSGVAASVRADVAALHRTGALVGVLGSVAPSRGDGLYVVDGLALAFAGWRALLSERVVLRPSLGLGLAIHRFSFAGEPTGHRLTPSARIPIELQLRLTERLHLGVEIAATLGRPINHALRDQTLWAAGFARLDLLVGLRFDGRH